MIWESSYYKNELIDDADIIERWSRKKRTGRQVFLLEKKIFISAYLMRKLVEANKTCRCCSTFNASVTKFSRINQKNVIYFMNWHEIGKFYDKDNPQKGSVNLKNLFDWIVHSYVFLFSESDDGCIDSFLFNSDKTKDDILYKFSLEGYVNILRFLGSSDIIAEELCRIEDGSGFKISSKKCSYVKCNKLFSSSKIVT